MNSAPMNRAPINRSFLHFIHKAHRRRIVWRALEHAGAGLVIACGCASLMLPLLWWRGDDAVMPTIAILLVGGATGVVASLRRIPSTLNTASLIEAQLQAPELLTSAMSIKSSEPSPFVD